MKRIDSPNNNYIKELSKLHQKKYRDLNKLFLIEGFHLVEEAKKAGILRQVLISDEINAIDGIDTIIVTEAIIERLTSTKNPQKIIGVCDFLKEREIQGNRFLLLDDVQDPGNLGTLVRSSLGFDIDLVIMSPSTVDIYNDKFLRSTQGAVFRVGLVRKELSEVITILKKQNVRIIGTAIEKSISLKEIPKHEKYAILLGNEGNGVNPKFLKQCDFIVHIETNPFLESLNVSVAGSIIMYYLKN